MYQQRNLLNNLQQFQFHHKNVCVEKMIKFAFILPSFFLFDFSKNILVEIQKDHKRSVFFFRAWMVAFTFRCLEIWLTKIVKEISGRHSNEYYFRRDNEYNSFRIS